MSVSKINNHMLVCANLLSDSSENKFYKTILKAYQNELVLLNPESNSSLSQFEPFKTKSKIKHSPPKSPSISLPASQEIFLGESPKKTPETINLVVDKILNGTDEAIFNEFSNHFDAFIDQKSNFLLINWFKRFSEDLFLIYLKRKFQNQQKTLEFLIQEISLENDNKKQNFQNFSLFEREILIHKSSKKTLFGLIYKFRIKSSENLTKNYLVLVDLFNVVEKLNVSTKLWDSLNSFGRGFYEILTDKIDSHNENKETLKIFKKILSNNNYMIISLVNLRDIEPYYQQIRENMMFLDKLIRVSNKCKNSFYYEIFNSNQTKIQKKLEASQKENKEIKKLLEEYKENLEKNVINANSLEKIKMELHNKEEIIKRMNQEKSIALEDKSLLEGILEETITNSLDSAQNIKKQQDCEKYKEFFIRLLKEYANGYRENCYKYANILDLNEKIKSKQIDLFLERETILLKELKESQENLQEYKEKYEKQTKELLCLNDLYLQVLEKINKLKETN